MSGRPPSNMHATAVELTCGDHSAGVLLLGPSGSGKSSLALQLTGTVGLTLAGRDPIDCRLVSDDQVLLHADGETLLASAPDAISGMLEVRGLGVVQAPLEQITARLSFAVKHSLKEQTERMPDPATMELHGITLPLHRADFQSSDCAARIRLLAQLHWGLLSQISSPS